MIKQICITELRGGPNNIVGDYGKAGIPISLRDPCGNVWDAMTGGRQEYGRGGFKFIARLAGQYSIMVRDDIWTFQHKGIATTYLSWAEVELPDKTSQQILEKLDRILAILERQRHGGLVKAAR